LKKLLGMNSAVAIVSYPKNISAAKNGEAKEVQVTEFKDVKSL